MSLSAKPVNTTVLIWWDLESVGDDAKDAGNFVGHLKEGIKRRFNLGDLSRYRTTVFHQVPVECDMRAALPDDADVIHTGPNKNVSQTVLRKAKEVLEDWHTNEVMLWAVTSDHKVIDVVRTLRQRGYNVFLVTDFTKLPKTTLNLQWLEIFSYYVICHGDLRKLMGHKVPRQTQHRTLGFKSPIMLTDLVLRGLQPTQPALHHPIPTRRIPAHLLTQPTSPVPLPSPSPSPYEEFLTNTIHPHIETPELLFA